jgi:2-hydroxy-4-carboxymuconate semialdehyde hemiacetal dehydrogenase
MRSKTGCLVSSANSFNNHGSITSNYRFIGEEATFLIEKGKLIDHDGNEVSVRAGGLEVQDREFLDAIKNGRTPMTSCKTCLPTMAILDRLQGIIGD